MNNSSRRHHYIPRFYLKNFTKNNSFYVIDKENLKKGAWKSVPKSICFEEYRNTMSFDNGGVKNSDIEDIVYKNFDDRHSKLIKEFCEKDVFTFQWTAEKSVLVYEFIALTYFRTTTFDLEYDRLYDTTDFIDRIGLLVSDGKSNLFKTSPEFAKEFMNCSNTKKALRHIVHRVDLTQYLADNNDNFEWRLADRGSEEDGAKPMLTSDNPILHKNCPFSPFQRYTELILPLSSQKFLINVDADRELHRITSPERSFFIDCLTFWRAKKYVICSSKDYLEELAKYAGGLDKERKNRIQNLAFDGF